MPFRAEDDFPIFLSVAEKVLFSTKERKLITVSVQQKGLRLGDKKLLLEKFRDFLKLCRKSIVNAFVTTNLYYILLLNKLI